MTSIHRFSTKTVKQLQDYLKERVFITSNKKKAQLISLCETAFSLNIEVHPDGLQEDKAKNVHDKLTTKEGFILKLPFLCDATLMFLCRFSPPPPSLQIFYLYNYLRNCNDFDHASMRDVKKWKVIRCFEMVTYNFYRLETFSETDKYWHCACKTKDKLKGPSIETSLLQIMDRFRQKRFTWQHLFCKLHM